ncbi:MAG TPA: hypothetical protein HPP94_09950 [Desulfuromonadales bacterium]|nr:hypothetical protein [Desulfuromonadales bacterium]
MSVKLGELLLQENLITPEQLDEALKNQVIFGIKLGSSLIELGFITDEQLCRLLSEKLGVPAVSSRALAAIPHNVLAHVPAELAGKYRVVPIRIEGKKLALAMSDPTDFKATDEVAFVTGFIVLPHIAPDVRITSALSRYYHVRGDIRYMMVEGVLESKRKVAPKASTDPKAEKIVISTMNESGETVNVEIPLEFEGFAALPGYEEDLADEAGSPEQQASDRLSARLSSARNRDQIAAAFIEYLGLKFSVVALIIFRKNVAVGWCGAIAGNHIADIAELNLPLGKPSVLKDVFESVKLFRGTLALTAENLQLLKVLGVGFNTPLLIVPIVMLKKVVAAVVVSAEMDQLAKGEAELQALVHKASLAFEMLILKNKILAI